MVARKFGIGQALQVQCVWYPQQVEVPENRSLLQGGSLRLLDPCAKCLDSRYAKDWNRRDGSAGTIGF